ncbi:hypothetical protein J7E93_25340 [Streptomyces sp. ISL-36]|uniref:hypothetical protein n=1 Tax=Streptomyces sp. ISL-36 TaxID=2819182 RepID=UPI001BE5AB54|nr:hypothetical protein [Streptomyces sp. ISL-36]MBT2443357.1 hypothetical protein [Streptomyces sp. ISL-36]
MPGAGDSGRYALALCKDVEGLFVEPALPVRVRYELRGCEPQGGPARAVAEAAVAGTAPLGTLYVEASGTPWILSGVRVLGARGDVVTVEATGEARRMFGVGPDACRCADLVRVSPPEPEEKTHTEVTFIGCSPRGELRDALAAGAEEFRAVRYQALTWVGAVHHEGDAGRITRWDTSTRHHGLVDLTVCFPRSGTLPPVSREIWDLFRRDRPAKPGTWQRFSGAARGEWLTQAAARGHGAPEIVPGTTYHLDGTHIVDDDSFQCAVGEAVFGPGRCFPAGAPRVIGEELAGTTLVWHDAHVARTCLGVRPYAGRRPATFQEIVDALTDAGVRVVLE